jgi:hypothetical protein
MRDTGMTMTSTPQGVTRRPLWDVLKTAAIVRKVTLSRRPGRSLHIALGLGLTVAFQGMTAGSAAVSTLPPGSMPRVTIVAKKPMLEPVLASNPTLVAAIFDAGFPQAKPQTFNTQPDLDTIPVVPVDEANEMMAFGARTAPRWLVHTILQAAQQTGVDPVYLMTLADVESSLSHKAKAPTSSAEGLFQFIDRTWLEIVHAHAAEHGFAAIADAISYVDGDPVVKNDETRSWIMSLRRDPYFSALMACELIKDVERELRSSGERELAEAELYLAHFLGAGSAVRFLEALDEQPNATAASLFPKAAKANHGLFTEKTGRKRRSITVAEFYERIDSKIIRRLDRFDDLTPTAFASTLSVQQTAEANALN